MLKELVTSLFCCLPHHHEAPVVERITPISVVSEEPYSYETYRIALREERYEDLCKIKFREIVQLCGQEVLDKMDELCEDFAVNNIYLQRYFVVSRSEPVLAGWKICGEIKEHLPQIFNILHHEAFATNREGDCLKAIYWWFVWDSFEDQNPLKMYQLLRKVTGQ